MPTINKRFLIKTILVLLAFTGVLIGAHTVQARRIPDALKRNIPQEPWVFEVTLNLDGRLCAVEKISGADGVFAKLLAQTMRQWKFAVFQSRFGFACYQTQLLIYVRERKGRATIEIPGITSSV